VGRGAQEGREAFARLARTFEALTGRPLADHARAGFVRYLDLLLIWNQAVRLTALESAREIVDGLFSDSLLFLARLPPRPLRVVDIGAGAGIPGVPLRIVDPEIRLTLVEARRKRVSFLGALKRALGLEDLEVIEGRAEVVVRQIVESGGQFDVVIARAVAPPAELVPTALSYLKAGGCFIASGPPADKLAGVTGLPLSARWEIHDFPVLGLKRAFLVATKGD
jgi:16S rRNA (guanine527-N7)-methyltransferase